MPQASSAVDWLRLETFGEPALERVKASVLAFAFDMSNRRSGRWLSLLGRSDTGKTHCALALWRRIVGTLPWNTTRCEYVPRFIYWPDFIEELRGGDIYAEFRDMANWPYLVLDDVFSERDASGFASDKLCTLLGCRDGKFTVVTSNLDLSGIAGVDARITSRLNRNGTVVELTTVQMFSMRPTKSKP